MNLLQLTSVQNINVEYIEMRNGFTIERENNINAHRNITENIWIETASCLSKLMMMTPSAPSLFWTKPHIIIMLCM